MYGANESAIKYNGKCRYIRITDIDEYGLLRSNKIVSAEYEDIKYKISLNDILFARSGATVGKAYIHENDSLNAIFAGYLIRFKIDPNKINPKFIFYFTQLNIYKQWSQAIQRSAGQPNINAEEYKDLDIPNLSKHVQKLIIDIMDKAYKEKKEKEKKATKLLDNIDDYLLKKLNISFPEIEDKTVQIVSCSDLALTRTDPSYHAKKYTEYYKSMQASKYEVVSIKKITESIASGSTPREKNFIDDTIPFVRLTDFNDLEVSLTKTISISREIHTTMLKRSQLKKGDILFGIAGSIGKLAIYTHEDEANINQAIARLRFKDGINSLYIAYILNSILVKFQTNKLDRPVAQPNLNIEELKSILVPLPPNNKKDGCIQDNIAKDITIMREQIQQLKLEAKTLLKEAKKEVEKIILGEE